MEANVNYQPVTVEVPEERIAEFHAFFARFLAGRTRRGHRHHGHGHGRGRRCAERRGQTEAQQTDVTESQRTDVTEA
jgi:hypothetical protein